MRWPTVPVGEIAQQVRGVSYDKSQVSNSAAPGLRPVLRAGNIQEGSLLLDKDLVYVPDSCIAHQQLLRPGDIVIAASSGSIDVVGKAAQLSDPWEGSFGAFCKVVRPSSDRVNPRYLHHFFQSTGYRRKVSSLAAGANINNLKNEHIDDLLLPLPPLEEQQRIAAILDKTAQVRCLLAKKELGIASLMKSAFVELFGHPQEASVGSQAPVVTLGDCCTLFSGGTLPAGEDNTGQEGGFLLLKVSDMNLPGNERSLKTSNLWSPIPGANSATCPAGSVVIPKRGGAIGTNKKRVVDRDAVLDPNLMALAPKEGMMTTEYLFGWFSFLDLSSITSGSSVPQLNKQDLSPLKVVLPPVETQFKYKEIALRVSLMAESLRREAISLQTLSLSLQHVAFGSANPE